jgi:hypothetical protein
VFCEKFNENWLEYAAQDDLGLNRENTFKYLDGEVLGALQDGRSARTEREGADRGGEGEQDDLLPVESEDELIEGGAGADRKCDQRFDGDVGLVAVKVDELWMTDDASSTTVEKCHLAMVEHRFGVFAQAEQATR